MQIRKYQINRLQRVSLGSLFALILGASQLAAHPHVFIDGLLAPRVSISSGTNYLEGVELRWSFDQIYSSQMIIDFDNNKDGKIDKAESKVVYEQAFVHLKEYSYFLKIEEQTTANHQSKIQLGTARDFQALIKDGKMIYQFYVPFLGAADKGLPLGGSKEYILFLEDPEYFIAFDSQLKKGLIASGAVFGSKEFMVQNMQWGPYSVHAVSVKGL